jgi:hypothetical protein
MCAFPAPGHIHPAALSTMMDLVYFLMICSALRVEPGELLK